MKRLFWLVQAAVFYILTLITAILPNSVTYRIGTFTGVILPLIIPKRKLIAVDNIKQTLTFMKAHPAWNSRFETAEEIAEEMFKNLGRSLMEICRLYHGKGEDIFAGMEVRGLEHYDAAVSKGKGVILLTGHCGNWELSALYFSLISSKPVSVVARRQNNPYLNRMVEKMRMSYKSKIIYKHGGIKAILSVLKKGDNIGLLADQAVSPEEGVLIKVLGRKAWASKAPVVLTRKSGSAILPCFTHREGGRHIITFYPEYNLGDDVTAAGIEADTEALSRYQDSFISAHPESFYWVHRRWKRTEGL